MKIIFETEFKFLEQFKHFPDREVKVRAALLDNGKIRIDTEWFRVTLEKAKTTRFKMTGKGSVMHKHLVDRSLDIFFEKAKENGVKLSF